MELEIKLMWCKGLSSFNYFQKLIVYAAVSIISEDDRLQLTQEQKQEQKTPADEEGDGSPEWYHTVKFDLKHFGANLQHLSVLFQLKHKGQYFGDKDIGEVRVPLKGLVESVGVGVGRFVSYEVTSPENKHNGILDFSYKVVMSGDVVGSSGMKSSDVQITGYVVHHEHYQHCHWEQHHQSGPSDSSGRIQYPKIDFDFDVGEMGTNNVVMPSQPPLVGGNDQFLSSSMAAVSPHYLPPVTYPPPLGTPQWGPPLPPPAPTQPYLPPPYGSPQWDYQRPPSNDYQQSNGGFGYQHW